MRVYGRLGLVVMAFGLAVVASEGPTMDTPPARDEPTPQQRRAFEEAFANADVNDPAFVARP